MHACVRASREDLLMQVGSARFVKNHASVVLGYVICIMNGVM